MHGGRSRIADFIHHESAGGLCLIVAAAIALLLDNSSLEWLYDGLLQTKASLRVGSLALEKPILLWINDGLMAVFFFLVGLEIKREVLVGELASPQQAALPAIAALGGMVVPALIYSWINWADAQAMRGWAIPSATDIAFAMGVLALLGNRVPSSIKVFLMALAVLDDLSGIVIIAVFYTENLSHLSLGLAAVAIAVLIGLNRGGVARAAPYVLVGMVLWVCVLKSGVHATLAGVATALAVPMRAADTRGAAGHEGGPEAEPGLLQGLIDALHPWVAFLILPLFAFANAGVSLRGLTWSALVQPIPLGIMMGLLLGKQIGIFGFTYAAVRAGLGRKPEGSSWLQIYGVSLVAGIGFTMSLFIGTLAFPEEAQAAPVRLGVLAGSVLSAALGYAVLRWASAEVATVTPPDTR